MSHYIHLTLYVEYAELLCDLFIIYLLHTVYIRN